MTTLRRTFLASMAALGLSLSTQAHAQAASYPGKTIKIVYTYAPGGTGDVIARTLAHSLTEILGQSVVVENRTGASGTIGTLAVANAPGDGYTLLLTTITTVVQTPLVTKDTSFDPVKSLVPIANLAMAPLVLVTSDRVPANDFPSFAEWVKKQAHPVNVAVAGPTLEVATALLARDAGLKFQNINYRGQAPALQAVLAGDVDVFFCPPSTSLNEFIRQGKIKVMGVTSAEPSPAMPGHTPISRHVPNYIQDINFALWSAPGTPPAIAAQLTAAVQKALAGSGIAEKFVSFGVPLAVAPAAEVTRITKREDSNIRDILKTVQINFGG